MKSRRRVILAFVAIALGVAWGAVRWPGEEHRPGADEGHGVQGATTGSDIYGLEAIAVQGEAEVETKVEGEDEDVAEAVVEPGDYPALLTRWISARGEAGRAEAITGLIEAWVANSPEEALDWLEAGLGGIERSRFIKEALGHWSETDIHAAADWIAGMADDQTKQAAVESMVRGWPGADRSAAVDWLENAVAPGPIREAGREALLIAWAADDWDQARAWFDGLESPGRTGALLALIEAEGARQAARAVALLADEVESPGYPTLVTAWLETVAAAQPAEGLAWLGEPERMGDAALWSTFIYEWAQHEPLSALDALENAPGEVPREESVFALFLRWVASDAAVASAQVSAIGDGPLRDAAVEGFSTGLMPFDPETSLIWANAIENPELRLIQRRALLDAWAERDPQAAARWLETSSEW